MQLDGLRLDTFYIPASAVSLVKSETSAGQRAEPWMIQGLASTLRQDQQGEMVLVKGLDLSYFDRGLGTFNWNHLGDKDPSAVIGLIKEYRRTPDGELFVKGNLLKALPKAQHCWNLLKALDEEGEQRRMGMSIEGKVLHKHNKVIYKAWVKAVALTMDPVNPDTYVSFAKSFSGAEYCAAGESTLARLDVVDLERALSVASTTTGSATGGSILTPEDLESTAHDLDYMGGDDPAETKRKTTSEKMSKGYTQDEAISLITQLSPRLSRDIAEDLVRFAFANAGSLRNE